MQYNWNQGFKAFCLPLAVMLTTSGSLFAGNAKSGYQGKAISYEEHPSNFGFAYPKDLNLTNPYDFYFYVEGLAFQVAEEGLSFAIANKAAPGTALLSDAYVKSFSNNNDNWDYQFGTRTGFGVYIDHDCWNLDFAWMWLNSTSRENVNLSPASTNTVIPMDLAGSSNPSSALGASVGSNWGCTFHVLDGRLAKPYHISRKVIVNPHFGLRFAQISQSVDADFGGSTTGAPGSNRVIYKGINNSWGLGLRAGFDSDWVIGAGWKFFYNCAASILSSSFSLKQKFAIPNAAITVNSLKEKYGMNVPNAEMAAGFAWGIYLGECKYYLDLRAGYEFHVFFDQMNLRRFFSGATTGTFANDTVARGNLTTNGFTLKLQLDL